MGTPLLVEIRPPSAGPLVVVVNRRLEVGRECDGVLIDDLLLSRRHLALWIERGQLFVQDLRSRNGTTLDGRVLRRRRRVLPGSTVQAGGTQIRLVDLGAVSPPDSGDERTGTRTTLTEATSADDLVVRPIPPDSPPIDASDARSTRIESVAREVVGDLLALDEMADAMPETGETLTFLFSDIEGSTRRAEEMGDRAWYRCLAEHNALVESHVADHGGTVVKSIGDGYMVTFASARAAARAGIDVQRSLAARALAGPTDPLRVRIGLHTGEAVEADGDLFGLHVNVAARVADRASGGQILVSALTRAITRVAGDLRFGPEQDVELKGLTGTYGVSELRWDDPPNNPG